jgi:uncharacterized BrkB/YihY/UPF0761 family membrane protein
MEPKKILDILKALPFDGGPSSTRFVYLAAAVTICLVIFVLTGTFCAVYLRSPDHQANAVVAALIGSTITAIIAFATSAQNTMHKAAQCADGSTAPPQTQQ